MSKTLYEVFAENTVETTGDRDLLEKAFRDSLEFKLEDEIKFRPAGKVDITNLGMAYLLFSQPWGFEEYGGPLEQRERFRIYLEECKLNFEKLVKKNQMLRRINNGLLNHWENHDPEEDEEGEEGDDMEDNQDEDRDH